MRRIDPLTVQRILDTADIVEVVSDFVNLKRRGSGYIGLCPFHNDRTPSFSVSKAKNICRCFSCGKGGTPLSFIMEHEQLSYAEALRYLARKYGIEIEEHEMSDEEKQQETERESMLAVNDFALRHFETNMAETTDGRNIGYAYFRERGINDSSIKAFHLGYALDRSMDLYQAAIAKGYKEEYLISTGLCGKTENGRVYDRFRGRVIYPVFSLSGKVVAFGGRTLRKEKDTAKYVNSPESVIYHKSNVLYGLYQARRSIVSADKCILVEGYMDVISMHQRGVENVVASSGTALTEGQIRLIRRFTTNVTVIYDSDAAGIKASLRGIDMLLAEGLNIKVLLLPDGDDPDSFAQNHSSSEVGEYIAANETDFIRFKTSILLAGVQQNDPIARSKVITDIVRSISVIPDDITRNVYVKECSRLLSTDEKVLTMQVARFVAERVEKDSGKRQRAAAYADIERVAPVDTVVPVAVEKTVIDDRVRFMRPFEREVLRYVLKYGVLNLCETCDENGDVRHVTVLEYVESELAGDAMSFSNPDFLKAFNEARVLAQTAWPDELERREQVLAQQKEQELAAGVETIRLTATTADQAQTMESKLRESIDLKYQNLIDDYSATYIERMLGSSADDTLRVLTTELVSEKYQLSKVHSKYSKIETEQDRLADLIPRAIYEWKDAILESRMHELKSRMQQAVAASDNDGVRDIMLKMMELKALRSELAKYLGERIITAR